MGKDKTKDKEHHDGETTASSETITSFWDTRQSNRDLSQDHKARETALAKTITEAVTGRWKRLMHTTRLFSMTEMQLQFQPALRLLQEQMVSRLWTPLTGPRTRLSTRDGNCGQKRLDSPLMPWKVTQKGLRFPTFITGSMESVKGFRCQSNSTV